MGAFLSKSSPLEAIRRRMAGSESESDHEYIPYHNYTNILQSLINSGQEQIRPSLYAANYDVNCDGNTTLVRMDKECTTNLNGTHFSLITKQESGVSGVKRKADTSPRNITNLLSCRENGSYVNNNFSKGTKCQIFNRYLPNEVTCLDRFFGKVFCGSFSQDGNKFITASQDSSIRLYDSSNDSYKFIYSIKAVDVGWSIVDIALSPRGENFVYSTWSSDLHLYSTTCDVEQQRTLTFTRSGRRFCIFSVVFSSDERELLGGANDGCLYIYDFQKERATNIPAHKQEINSVCFADDSSQIIYSGGDDGLIKVWDRRSLNEKKPVPVGILAGHMDGITFVDSRGDGRHLISNSKDQSIKLWDVRVFSSAKSARKLQKIVKEQTWDYRWQEVPKKLLTNKKIINGDTSIMTYKGHVVIKTLIRCRFSPKETTGQRFIYTGCGTGRVVIYDSLTGEMQSVSGHGACVRDVDWHPQRNEILSSSWDGTVGKWTYASKDYLDETDHDYVVYQSRITKSPRYVKRKKATS